MGQCYECGFFTFQAGQGIVLQGRALNIVGLYASDVLQGRALNVGVLYVSDVLQGRVLNVGILYASEVLHKVS